MARTVTFAIDPATGRVLVEGLSPRAAQQQLGGLLGDSTAVNCGLPASTAIARDNLWPAATSADAADNPGRSWCPPEASLQVVAIYHGAMAEGPGRRSVVQLQGCSIRCPGCYRADLWAPDERLRLRVADVAAEATSEDGLPRDGITILGGEPFDQPAGLANLVRTLKAAGVHTVVYSGYTLDQLLTRARQENSITQVLEHADVLIDGPFVKKLAQSAGEYRGSRNQRIVDLSHWRRTGGEVTEVIL